LVRLPKQIGAQDRAVEVWVLQYGATRDRLREMLEEGEGWDIIHVSGHGAPGELLLETGDGSRDPVTAGIWRICWTWPGSGSSWSRCRRAGRRR
jgi:hypothetical protein